MSPSISPPRVSPRILISSSGYFDQTIQRPRDASADSNPIRGVKFEKGGDPNLGIHMVPIVSPTSPDNIYRFNPHTTYDGQYSPLSSSLPRPEHLKTPDDATSFDSSFSRSRTDPITERLIRHRATQAAQWKIHWRTPTLILVSLLTGIFLALGQHMLYQSLHHKAEHDEEKKIRVVLYGRALAYLSKVALGGCVILCYRQRIWRTFREQALSVWSIDQLFLATEDPSLFLNWETISKAGLLTAMALVIWLIPIATIVFSPAALTFGDVYETGSSTILVPTLNFTAESYKDWRKPVVMPDGTKKRSLIFSNTTDRAADTVGWFDYYDQPSADLKRISLMSAYSLKDQFLNRGDARLASCGGDYNCTYAISFVAPGYNCKEIANGIDDDQKLADAGAPFNTSMLVPRGPHVYYANVDMGDYRRPQPAEGGLSNQGGVPIGYYAEDFGYFKSEPVLWIGYSVNSTQRLPAASPLSKNWTHRYDPHVFACTHYETKYTVGFNYSGPFFTTDIVYDFLNPVVDTNFSRFDDGTMNANDPGPASNFISPSVNPLLYKKIAAYHAMGERLRNFLRGNVELEPPLPGPSYAKVYSDVTMTRLVSNSSSTPRNNLPDLLQDFYVDMILSLLSAPHMLVVSEEKTQVAISRYHSTFIYKPRKLWACYTPVIFFVFIFLLMGMWTIWEDGTTFSVGFSRIMVTTRNTTLDDISRGACLGNDPFPTELMNTRLKFGVLNEGGHENEYMGIEGLQGAGHCAFGVPSELTSIRRGVPYAGLQRRRAGVIKKEKVD